MIFSLVVMTGIEKCCITSAYLQWLCHSGEQPVAHGPLVLYAVIQTLTGHPVTGHPVTGQLGIGQPGTSHQSFAYDFQNVPLQNYAPSISSHVSHGCIHRQPNVHTPGYEHSEMSEFPNPATSSKQLIPLEPDFSQMSDPSAMIDPPISTNVSQTRPSRKEQSRRDHKSKTRRRHRSSSSSSSISRSDSWRKKNSKRSKHSTKKSRRWWTTPSSSSNTSQSQIDFGR